MVALIPVWRLNTARWPVRWLSGAWLVYTIGILVGIRLPGPARIILPIVIVLYVAPFVIRPERLTRLLQGRGAAPRPVIDVTPKPAPGLGGHRQDDADDQGEGAGR